MNLFELTSEYKSALDVIYDTETGEILETSLLALDKINSDIKSKVIAVASYIKNLEAEKDAIESAMDKMHERANRLSMVSNFFRAYLKSNMEKCEINEVSCPYFDIKIKKNPVSVDIVNEELISDEYRKKVIKEIVSIDKVKIKEVIQAGGKVTGAELKQNTRLEIK